MFVVLARVVAESAAVGAIEAPRAAPNPVGTAPIHAAFGEAVAWAVAPEATPTSAGGESSGLAPLPMQRPVRVSVVA